MLRPLIEEKVTTAPWRRVIMPGSTRRARCTAAGEVDIHDVAPGGQVGFVHRFAAGAAGVVDEHVDVSELCFGAFHRRLDVDRIAQVPGVRRGDDTGGKAGFDHRAEHVRIARAGTGHGR